MIDRAYLPSRYGLLHYRIVRPAVPGDLPPLLCMHQTPGNGGDWAPVMPALGKRRIVIAVDTPGYGMSDPPPAPVTIEDFAEVMAAFLSDLAKAGIVGEGPVDLLGYHTGSLIATQLACAFPDLIRRVAMFGLAAYPPDMRATKLARLREHFPVPQRNLDHVEKLWAIMLELSDPRMSAEQMHVAMAECLRLGTRMPWAYEAVYRYDFLEAMTRVVQPALILNPQDDLWDVTRDTSDGFPQGRRHDMPGVRHGVLSIEHDQVVRELEVFFG
ncbi:alpha/beta fold hydrolase [Sphingobium sp. YR768]|uniref:alpha/beta fold hydrolase n=1 Tax=Sphingobium sp. YR768 TaxID=1884365 RepID=UPI0008B4CB65|nr:alpha/beta fold hydrolase [Sphingobium sp. YR768]SER80773.1 Pimeloyl-ACP methyl ester carboxylesterase [Sphingobium sp. YR768]